MAVRNLALLAASLASSTVAALPGGLTYLGWASSGQDAPQLSYLDLTSNASTPLIAFPSMSYGSLFFQNTVWDWTNGIMIVSMQYDSNITQGLLLEYDLTTKSLLRSVNSTYCWYIEIDEADPTKLLCLTGAWA